MYWIWKDERKLAGSALARKDQRKLAAVPDRHEEDIDMPNWCSNAVVITAKDKETALEIRDFLKTGDQLFGMPVIPNEPPPVDPEAEIAKNILPVRDNCRDRRKIKSKEAVYFLYRVA